MEDDKLESRALSAPITSNSFNETSFEAKERGVFSPYENISFCSVKQNPVITETVPRDKTLASTDQQACHRDLVSSPRVVVSRFGPAVWR